MWPHKPIEYVQLDEDRFGKHYGLFVDDELVSIVSLFVENKEAQFRKFATLQSSQGKGYGSQLLKFVFAEVEVQNIKRIWCNARKEKTAFYQRFCMIETQETFSKGGIEYVIMEKFSR